jgi:5'-AMP-activated protein kinase catalytic alpha subunit
VQGYTLHEILGKGSFGQVFKATKSGKVFAIKMIDKPLIRKKNLQKYVNNEVKVMRELKNPNTVRLYEAFEDKDVLYLVMECCN